MIYTSYYSNINNLQKNIIPVSIAGRCPIEYSGLQYKKLAPKIGFFKEWKINHNNDYYIDCFYKEVLNKLDVHNVVMELQELVGNNNSFAMICYEKPGEFCHRHLVASWMISAGYPVIEYS